MGKNLLDDLNVIKKLSKDQKMECIRILRDNANQSLYWDSIMLQFRELKIEHKTVPKIENGQTIVKNRGTKLTQKM